MKLFIILTLLFFNVNSLAADPANHNTTRSNKTIQEGSVIAASLKNLDDAQSINKKAELLKTRMVIGTFMNILAPNTVDNDCDDYGDDGPNSRAASDGTISEDALTCTLIILTEAEVETLALYARSGKIKFFNGTKGFGYTARGGDIRVRKRPGRVSYADSTLTNFISDLALEDLDNLRKHLDLDGSSSEIYMSGDFLEQTQLINEKTDFLRAQNVIEVFVNNLMENFRVANRRLDTDDDGDSVPTKNEKY
jgi:hypothetical protein